MEKERFTEKRPRGTETAPQWGYLIWGYGLVALAIAAAIVLAELTDVKIEVGEGFAPFAAIYIVAQAIERFIQPFTTFTVGADDKRKNKTDLLAAESVDDKKEGQKELEAIHSNRSMAYWAAATVLALLVCGALGLGLIHSVAHLTGGKEWTEDLDIVITGIAVGSGTKPLHDLISFIKNTKENSESKGALR
jgi:hypothetical protein